MELIEKLAVTCQIPPTFVGYVEISVVSTI